MQLKFVADDERVLVLKTEGTVTQESIGAKGEPFYEMFGSKVYGRRVVLDLAGSDYIDSSGVGLLVAANRRFKEAGGRLVLHSVSAIVMNVLKILRLHQVLNIAGDADEARGMALGDGDP